MNDAIAKDCLNPMYNSFKLFVNFTLLFSVQFLIMSSLTENFYLTLTPVAAPPHIMIIYLDEYPFWDFLLGPQNEDV